MRAVVFVLFCLLYVMDILRIMGIYQDRNLRSGTLARDLLMKLDVLKRTCTHYFRRGYV